MTPSTERRKISHASPIFIAILTVLLGASVTFIGWVGDTGVRFLESNFKTLNDKQDLLFRKIADVQSKENSDVLCMNRSMYACCGTKASVQC